MDAGTLSYLRTFFMDTVRRFQADEGSRFGASIAYYSVFSLVPLLVIAIAVAGFFFGASDAQDRILAQTAAYVGEEGRQFIEETVRAAGDRRLGTSVAGLSIILVLLGAAAVFKELKDALNRVFDAPLARGGIFGFFRKNLLLFGLVLAMGFLLLVSLVLSALLSFSANYFNEIFTLPPFFWQTLNFVVSLVITAGLFMLLYRFLPDVRLPWRFITLGALVTAILFTLGKSIIGFYLGRSDPASAYGAAGTIVLVLLWTYYSSQIVLFGAELTATYATREGHLAYRAEIKVPSSLQSPRKKDFLAQVAGFLVFFFLRRIIRRLFRKF